MPFTLNGLKELAAGVGTAWASTDDGAGLHTPLVGFSDRVVLFAPTVTGSTSPAYTTADNVGGLLTITSFARVAAGSGQILSARIVSAVAQTCFFDLYFFNANPSTSTFTDNAATVITAADQLKVIGVMHLNDVSALAASSVHQSTGQPLDFVLPAAATTAYAAIVVRGGPTLTATGDLTLSIKVRQS